jgi:hypothetical protein
MRCTRLLMTLSVRVETWLNIGAVPHGTRRTPRSGTDSRRAEAVTELAEMGVPDCMLKSIARTHHAANA